MADDRPAWARRMYNERQARGWSQADAIRAMPERCCDKMCNGNGWPAGELVDGFPPNCICVIDL